MRLTQSLAYPPPKLRVFDLVRIAALHNGIVYKNCASLYLRIFHKTCEGVLAGWHRPGLAPALPHDHPATPKPSADADDVP